MTLRPDWKFQLFCCAIIIIGGLLGGYLGTH